MRTLFVGQAADRRQLQVVAGRQVAEGGVGDHDLAPGAGVQAFGVGGAQVAQLSGDRLMVFLVGRCMVGVDVAQPVGERCGDLG